MRTSSRVCSSPSRTRRTLMDSINRLIPPPAYRPSIHSRLTLLVCPSKTSRLQRRPTSKPVQRRVKSVRTTLASGSASPVTTRNWSSQASSSTTNATLITIWSPLVPTLRTQRVLPTSPSTLATEPTKERTRLFQTLVLPSPPTL